MIAAALLLSLAHAQEPAEASEPVPTLDPIEAPATSPAASERPRPTPLEECTERADARMKKAALELNVLTALVEAAIAREEAANSGKGVGAVASSVADP